jgi:DNA helicase-2/ATP-dependent DNA helicase PcrA
VNTQDQTVVNPDAAVDAELRGYVDPQGPRSFFLYAGAGSGKTRSLVSTLNHIRETHGDWLWLRGKRVGVITYTNAAADEIKRRAMADPLFEVATIHSFLWSLIGGYNADIREWLRVRLQADITELEAAQQKGRSASKAAQQRARDMVNKTDRLANLDQIRVFTYSPTGDNRGRDALNHAEVIAMGSAFIAEKPALRRLLVGKYPILLIDESQDTNKLLVDALLHVEEEFSASFCLGFFGDMMQRIYADGKARLPEFIPERWAKPAKAINHRSPERIVRLINKVRSEEDDHVQQHRPDKPGGIARLFIASNEVTEKSELERRVRERMAEITGDDQWTVREAVKTLGLEHLMLARRMGFAELFAPLYAVERIKTGLLDGSLPGLRFFVADVLPVVAARQRGDEFQLTALLRKRSPLLQPAVLKREGQDQTQNIIRARDAVAALCALWENERDPTCREVLTLVADTGLFEVPDSLKPHVEIPEALAELAALLAAQAEAQDASEESEDDADDEEDTVSPAISAWEQALEAPMSQVSLYADYVAGVSPFDTHQGVKGLQFPRVMVVIDDQEARGFMFSYEKLLGAKPLSSTDLGHQEAGEESTLDRTRRLLYVTASRAEQSLAVVAYSAEPEKVRETVVAAEWFSADETEIVSVGPL